MKQVIYLFLLFFSFGAAAQEFSFSKESITFPNGKTLNNPVNSPVPQPTVGNISYIFAEFSNGITGNVTSSNYVGDVELFAFDNHFFRETDDAGRPINNGSIKKDQFVIYKKIDPSSADLIQHLANNSTITEIIIKMVNSNGPSGIETKYTLTLNNSKVIHHRYISEYHEASGTFYFYEKINLHVPSFEFKDINANQAVTIN